MRDIRKEAQSKQSLSRLEDAMDMLREKLLADPHVRGDEDDDGRSTQDIVQGLCEHLYAQAFDVTMSESD
jgi:hypothetical protein